MYIYEYIEDGYGYIVVGVSCLFVEICGDAGLDVDADFGCFIRV